MTRPRIAVGTAVKVYIEPNYGRQDAYVTALNPDGTINAKTSRLSRDFTNLIYKEDTGDRPQPVQNYWTELPEGYVPGSEGH